MIVLELPYFLMMNEDEAYDMERLLFGFYTIDDLYPDLKTALKLYEEADLWVHTRINFNRYNNSWEEFRGE